LLGTKGYVVVVVVIGISLKRSYAERASMRHGDNG
jgi:hypothetical protein